MWSGIVENTKNDERSSDCCRVEIALDADTPDSISRTDEEKAKREST